MSDIFFDFEEMRLPDWLDKKLFVELGANYNPDPNKVKYTLNFNEEELKMYLGTYFPRSFCEAYRIFEDIFQNDTYLNILSKEKEINILDFGCGTGGQLIGLATALEKYLPSCKKLNIIAFDGNKEALNLLSIIVKELKQDITFNPIEYEFTSTAQIYLKQKFHFILNSKMINELINQRVLENDAYFLITKKLSEFLAENGIFYILDVTTPLDKNHTIWFPEIMNKQLNKFILENQIFSTLLPLSCGKHDKCKRNNCFTQMIFKVSHSRKECDLSKVSYRIICRKELKNLIIQDLKDYADYNKHIISNKRYQYGLCPMGLDGKEDSYVNSFRLTKQLMK